MKQDCYRAGWKRSRQVCPEKISAGKKRLLEVSRSQSFTIMHDKWLNHWPVPLWKSPTALFDIHFVVFGIYFPALFCQPLSRDMATLLRSAGVGSRPKLLPIWRTGIWPNTLPWALHWQQTLRCQGQSRVGPGLGPSMGRVGSERVGSDHVGQIGQ